ncbi:hypothetical protein K502DRAFT_323800 [Neoconidiobolus thromboides FSU 785]|nr:hypothetical protein K502DRAFT_323800 [Neoconidiobolus thromboides FSU 785]
MFQSLNIIKRIQLGQFISFLSFMIIITIAISAGLQNNKGYKKSPLNQFIEENKSYEGVLVYLTIEDINPSERTIQINSNIKLSYNLYEKIKGNNETVNILVHHSKKSYQLYKDRPIEQSTLIDFQTGEPDNYPFDSYECSFPFKVYTNNSITLDTKFDSDISYQLFNINFSTELKTNEFSLFFISLKVKRANLAIFFSFLIHLILWCLPISLACLAINIFMNKVTIPAPLLTFGPVMLFSISAIRAAQPGIPEVGVLIDLFGYIWSVVIISISSIVIILCWVVRS